MNENISIKEGGITRKFSPIDKVKVNNTEWIATSELDTSPLTKPIPFGKLIHRTGTYHSGGRYWEHHTWISGGEAEIAYGSKNFHYMIASSQPGSYTTENYSFTIDDKEADEQSSSSSTELDQTYTANGKTVYYIAGTNSFAALKNAELYPTVNTDFYESSHLGEIAWTMIYGTITEEVSAQSIWMPKDDMKTGTLYATENGIYIATEDGYDAYSEVVIRVEKRIDDNDLIDESGADWKDIDFDGDVGNFDELDNWDVDTLEEFSDDLEGFDDLFNDEDKWDEEKEKPITENEMDDFAGDSISGIDPETGNEMEVSLDEDGFLDEEVLPSQLVIITPPDRLKYQNGDTIDFTGMIVNLLYADGTLYTSDKYPDGVIDHVDLVFPVTIANFGGEGIWYATSNLDTDPLSQPIAFAQGIHRKGTFKSGGQDWEHHTYYSGGEAAIAYGSKNFKYLIAARSESTINRDTYSFTTSGESKEQSSHSESTLVESKTINGKTVYYIAGTDSFADLKNAELYPTVDADFYNSSKLGEIAWTLIYGEIKEEASVEVPVDFIRDDGEVLEDTFTITVGLGEGSGGGDSGGGGNDSPDIADYQLNNQDVVGLYYDPESKKVIAPNIGEYTVNQAIDIGLLIPKKNKKPWESD